MKPFALMSAISILIVILSPVHQNNIADTQEFAGSTAMTIFIIGNDELSASSAFSNGSGTESDPFVMDNETLNITDYDCVIIMDTDLYFRIENTTITDSNRGISFYNVTHGTIVFSTFINNSIGIYLRDSSECIVTNNTISRNYYGIFLWETEMDATNNDFSNNHQNVFEQVTEDRMASVILASTVAIVLLSIVIVLISILLYYRRKGRPQ